MKIMVERDLLINAVNTAEKAVAAKSSLPILENILISAQTDIRMTGNNLELGIETKVAGMIIQPGAVCVEAKIFNQIVRKLPEGQVNIDADNENITISCEKTELKIKGFNATEYPGLPDIEKENSISITQGQLKDFIRQTIFSVSVEETRPVLTGEYICAKDKKLSIVAIDGFRVSYRSCAIDSQVNLDAVAPAKTMIELSKILGSKEKVTIFFTDKHLLFDLGDTKVVSRVLGEYIPYEHLLQRQGATSLVINRNDLLNAIDRASIVTKDAKKNPIKIDIQGNRITISSDTTLGKVKEEIEGETQGDDLTIGFNPLYFLDALRNIEDEKVKLVLSSPVNPCLILDEAESDRFKYLILPVRLGSN